MTEAYLPRDPWRNAGNITSAQSAPTTDKSVATLEALAATKRVIIKPGVGKEKDAIELRFRSDAAANGTDVLQLYGAVGSDDHYTHIAQLTTRNGSQIHSGSILFVDAITPNNEAWLSTVSEVNPAVEDTIARYVLNTHGYDRFLIIASTRNSTTVYVDWRGIKAGNFKLE